MVTYIYGFIAIISYNSGGLLLYGLEVEWSGVTRLINTILCALFVYLIISQMTHTVDSYCVRTEGGHLECMKYLHENGCPWNVETCETAAFWGHLELSLIHI